MIMSRTFKLKIGYVVLILTAFLVGALLVIGFKGSFLPLVFLAVVFCFLGVLGGII